MKYTQILQIATKILFIGLFTSVYTVSFAQDWDRLSVDFREDGKLLLNSGINGMVAPQFSNIDFNGDGDTDLFVFDRQSGVVMTFVWEDSEDGGRLVYDPQYAANFPELVQFARLVDYDRDGDMDIFTFPRLEPASSIELFRNEGTDQNPDYVAVKFPNSPSNVLSYILSNGQLETIYTASTDVPAIVDVNGDGDLDVLTFEQNAGSLVNYFENQQVESGLPKDSMIFRLQDLCWGKFFEAGDNSNIFLSDDPNSCSNGGLIGHGGGGSERHAGSTIEVFDVNGDGLVDATIGDLSNNRIVYLQNGGSLGADWMNSQIPNFPGGANPVSINIFLSSFFVDVTNDGLVDFIAAPNEKNTSWNAGHVWMYENVGSETNPLFELVTKEFLYESSLRIPEWSKPAFVDIDQDGLLDLLVGCFRYRGVTVLGEGPRLFYYRNIGNAQNPAYELMDRDFLNVSAIEENGTLAPTVGDMDNDGDQDLLIGDSEGQLLYFENIATAGGPYEYDSPVYPFSPMDTIDIGKTATPQIIDIDEDGKVDLLIGGRNDRTNLELGLRGGVNYFQNQGTAEAFEFTKEPTQEAFGDIFTRSIFTSSGYSAPKVIRNKEDDDFIFLVGSSYGNIYMYDQVVGHLQDSFNLVTDSIPVPRYGGRTGLDLADIDNDNYYEMVIGNENGGLAFHNTTIPVAKENSTVDSEVSDINIFPNPAQDKINILWTDQRPDRYELYSVDGRQLMANTLVSDEVNISSLSTGMYILKLSVGANTVTKKLIID